MINHINKKGFLLAEETLKIVVAVISITFLIYFLTSLYFARIDGENLRKAEAVLKGNSEGSIKTAMGNLDRINPVNVKIPNPEGWYFFSFVQGEKKPNSCVGGNCLCICDNVIDNILLVKNRQISECDKKGTCLNVKGLVKFNEIKIKNPQKGLMEIKIDKKDNLIFVKELK